MSDRSGSGFSGVNPSSNDNAQCGDGCNSDRHGFASSNDGFGRELVRSVNDVCIVKHPSELAGTLAAHGDADSRFDVFRFSAHGLVARCRVASGLFRASLGMLVFGESVWVSRSQVRTVEHSGSK
jgi:hypothetical protein